jgi:hypothetical protein
MHRERKINRRQQGDLGEASAIEWLTRQGATVFIPFGHSPDVDLVAEVQGDLLRVQVKTSTYAVPTGSGGSRFLIQLATNGGNQSWTGVAKRFDSTRFDLLFVLAGNGRRWLIPAHAIEAETTVTLGGPKYADFEIDVGASIEELVYEPEQALVESDVAPGEYRSGQTGQTVNLLAKPSQVRILPPPSRRSHFQPSKFERAAGRTGQAVIWPKRRLTIPRGPFTDAGLDIGDRVRARCDGPGRLILDRIQSSEQLELGERRRA